MAEEIRAALGDDFDAEAFLDTLDGETDAADIADRLLAELADAEAMAEAIRGQEADMKARRQRYDMRGEAFRRQLLNLLDAIGEKKIERPRATVSRRAGLPSVQITDEAAIPSQLCKTTVAPDKAAIKAQLLAGEAVPGAQIVVGDDGVTVRTK
ncbi:MAG TPA: siphovirus Gp157 family protein [Azonexus sp.]|nr:siphovirus Gp157 family protein [Azonexus sp.]